MGARSNSCVIGAFRYVTGGNGGTATGTVWDPDGCDYRSDYDMDGNPNTLTDVVHVTNMVRYVTFVGDPPPGDPDWEPTDWPAFGDSGGPIFTWNNDAGQATARGIQGSRGYKNKNGVRNWYGAYSKLGDVPASWGDPILSNETCHFLPFGGSSCPAD